MFVVLKMKNYIKAALIIGITSFVALESLAKRNKPKSIYDNNLKEKNPFQGTKVTFVQDDNDKENADGVKGHLESDENNVWHVPGVYEKVFKRDIDIILSYGGLVILSPALAAISVAIKIEDPGPVLFTQKRVGKNKEFFQLHKFRSMKVDTPHDIPTHQLDNPDQYITKVGSFIRKHSLDELPQIWDIFVGNMSIIGPRPALWNQDLLVAERDKYCANDVKPGLTGLAQINGRDELEIFEKAKLDGEYTNNLSFTTDLKIFIKSLKVFGKDETVVEGGTGEINKEKEF